MPTTLQWCLTHATFRAGECSSDINVFCVDVKPGASQLADCLSQQHAEEQKEGYSGNKVSARCIKELDAFKIDRASNINKNVPLCAYLATLFDCTHHTRRPQPRRARTMRRSCANTHHPASQAQSSPACGAYINEQIRTPYILNMHILCTCKHKHNKTRCRERKAEVSETCATELLDEMREGADDFRKDPRLHELCRDDAQTW